jgi:hypothetical protein
VHKFHNLALTACLVFLPGVAGCRLCPCQNGGNRSSALAAANAGSEEHAAAKSKLPCEVIHRVEVGDSVPSGSQAGGGGNDGAAPRKAHVYELDLPGRVGSDESQHGVPDVLPAPTDEISRAPSSKAELPLSSERSIAPDRVNAGTAPAWMPAPIEPSVSHPSLVPLSHSVAAHNPLPQQKISAPGPAQTDQSLNYNCLTGLVQQWHKSWRLRYAGVDVEDRYGGSVTLVGDGKLDQLRDGQRVRITGQMLNPQERMAPRYQVQFIEILDR